MIGMCAPKALAHAMAPAGVVVATDPNLWGAAKLARACADAPGKPRAAFGLEIRLREWPGHVVLLARTALGWRNLCAVAALVYGPADAVDLPPRAKPPHSVPLATLVARGLLGGLAVLTGGAAGCLCVSLGGPTDHATRLARELGPGGDHARADAFLEAIASACDQWIADRIAVAPSPRAATPEEAPRLYVELAPTMGAAWRACWEAAIRHDLDVVATSDASYLRREDAPTRLVLRAIAEKRRLHLDEIAHLAPSSRAALEEPSAWGHLASDEEMSAFFADCPAALESARSLGEELRVDLGLGKVALPDYRDASGRALDAPAQVAELARLASDGLARRLVERRKARGAGMHRTEEVDASYRRLREELGVIERTGFAGYFLIVADFCQWARRNGIPLGPGRGSAAGSLAVYALGITDVDPERWGLMFERFLNAERAGGMPDIDVDICKRGRVRVIDYLRDRYGADAVGRIATFSAMGGKSALKDVGRVLGVGFGELNRALAGAPALVNGKTPTVAWLADNVESLREAVADPSAPSSRRLAAVVRHALAIEAAGCVRQAGTHASGVVVSRGPLADWVPISGAGHDLATQWAMEEVELAGLVKLDLLGLSTVTHLALAERYVNDANSEEKRGSHVEQDVLARTDGRALAQPGTAPRRALGGVAGSARADTPPRRGDAHLADRELLLPDGDDARGREAAAGRAWREGEALRSGELRDGDAPPRRPEAPAVSRAFSLDRVPLDDAATLRLVAAADTLGIFQLGKGGMRRLLAELVPDRYEDIVAACALYRPGPIQGGMVKDYVARRHGRTRVEYLHPALEATTGDTYGVWCIAAGQRVLTSSGWREIERVGRGDMVMTQSGDWHEVRARHDNGTRDTFAVRMTNGEELIATSEHKILTARGWVAVCDLTRSDLVQQVWGSDEEIPDGDDRDWIVGLALADGDLCGATPTISCSSREFAERVKTIADAAWGLDCAVYFAGRAWYVALTAGRGAVGVARPNPFTRHLRRLGLLGCDFSTKFFPQRVSLSMAAGFYEGDGSTLNNRLRVKNEALARRFWEILQARRIDSSLFIDKGDVWTVAVSGRLPLRLKVKGEIFGGYVPKPDLSFIPRSDERRQLRWNKRSFITKEALRRISEDYDRDLVPSTPWGRVLAVRPCGARRVYDLTVDTDHSYVVGGSLVHNCYQEQVMAAARALAGYTLGQADILRKAMGKKKPEVMAKERAKFVAGCVRMGSCDEARATELFELVAKWAGYGFNKSVDADTLIRDTSGNEKRLADFVPGDLVWSLGMEGNREQTSVVAVHDHGVLDGFAVEFDDGTAVVCTLDHKFLTEQGQKPLWQIVADDSEVLSVGTPNENDRGAVRRDDEEWADFCASEHAPIADTRRLVRRRVVRVVPVGPRRMYDLEVSSSTHNYILPGGVVTSNSHSVCYGLISYRTAYVKAHYPAAFYAAWLSILCDEADATKKIAEAVYDARAHGIAVLPPNVNASAVDFLPVTLPPSARLDDRDGTGRPAVLYGLGALRGLGAAATSQIVARRPFRSLDDFLSRVEINKRDLVALAGSGALDPLLPEGVSRARVLANLTPLVSYAKRARSPQLSLL